MKNMQTMRVFHFAKKDPSEQISSPEWARLQQQGVWTLDTCQRVVVVQIVDCLDSDTHFPLPKLPDHLFWETYSNEHAYRFLLELSCGLHSALVGETEIAGQIKNAWKSFETSAQEIFVQSYRPWFEAIFRDTKIIRSEHLQGMGGSSYGTLVRKILRPSVLDPILIVGAGQMAEAVLPYLKPSPVILWNRNVGRASTLAQRVSTLHRIPIEIIEDLASKNLSRICHLLLCIPADDDFETKLQLELLPIQRPEHSRIVHFGRTDENPCLWTPFSGYFSLGSIFSIRDRQNKIRSLQISKAQSVAQEMALRSLQQIQERSVDPSGTEALAQSLV